MGKKSATLIDELVSRLKPLETTRKKIESFSDQGLLVRRDVEKVYEALYLRAFTEFEALVETLFIGLLTGRFKPPSQDVVPRVQFRSEQTAREIVYGGRNYVDWFPYDRTEKMAGAFFRGGRPFVNLGKPDKQEIEKLHRIRNAIAHNSPHAMRMFISEVIGSTPLTPREKTPAGFLRSQLLSISTPLTRYEYFTIEMVGLIRKICG